MGWHEDEFDFMGVPFEGRGRRADEAIRLMRALWNGDRAFEGEYWSFHDATSEPAPVAAAGDLGRRQLGAGDRRARDSALRGLPHADRTPTMFGGSRVSTRSYA